MKDLFEKNVFLAWESFDFENLFKNIYMNSTMFN